MKKYYFGLLLLFTMHTYGQDNSLERTAPNSKESTFKLYPNPATNGVVYITTETNNNKEIVIYDVFGEIVLTDRIKTKALNISRLVAGVYVLQVTENNETMTRKLVVK
jgi:hypothetical protein